MRRIKTWSISESQNKIEGRFTGGRVTYSFNDEGLTSLKGTHLEIEKNVTGNFYCASNELTDLKGAPEFIGGDFYHDFLYVKSGDWNTKGLIETIVTVKSIGTKPYWVDNNKKAASEDDIVRLIMTSEHVSDSGLDKYFTEHPTELYVLDELPEIKKGILKRTGIKDLSRLGRTIKTGLI